MGKVFSFLKRHVRTAVQFCFTCLTNGYAAGFVSGKIFKGKSKLLCVPGLNCYSCPGALGSCPIGSFQAVLADSGHRFSFYVAGFLMLVGAVFGRFVCGWLCPFGLLQDLLYKIPFVKKLKKLPGDKFLKYLKYIVLVLFVIVFPLCIVNEYGQGQPWFCKYICPSGTLFAGIPLVAANPSLQKAVGLLFSWKTAVLLLILLLSVLSYRPFCRYLCPLGAVYSIFNPIAFYRYKVDESKCTKCGKCQKVCQMDIPVYEKPNSPECIRCGKCVKACPHSAIKTANFK